MQKGKRGYIPAAALLEIQEIQGITRQKKPADAFKLMAENSRKLRQMEDKLYKYQYFPVILKRKQKKKQRGNFNGFA